MLTEKERLIQELESCHQQIANLKILVDISRITSLTLDPNAILSTLARKCCQVLDATSVYIGTVDRQGGTTTVIAEYFATSASSKEKVSDLGISYDVGKDFPLLAEWSRNPKDHFSVHVNNLDHNAQERAHLIEYGAKSSLVVPFLIGEDFLGFIELWESRQHREFKESEIELTKSIAKQIKANVVNARLYQQVRESNVRAHRNEMRYRALFEQSNDAVFILDLEGNHLDVNQKATELLGYTQEELLKLSAQDIIEPNEYLQSKHKLQMLYEGQLIPPYERIFLKKDGTPLTLEVNVEIVKDENDTPIYLQSIARDITKRQLAEENQKKHYDLLQQIIDNNPNVVIVKDQYGKFVVANQAAERQYGKNAEEMLGKTDLELHSIREEAEAFIRGDQRTLETLQIHFIAEEPVTYADGTRHWHQSVKIPLMLSDDQYYVMAVGTNISIFKEAERNRIELAIEKEQVQLLEAIIADLSHDIKTPLSTISNYIYLLKKNPAKRDQYIKILEDQLQYLTRLFDDILTSYRLEKGANPDLTPVDISSLIENIHAKYDELLKQKQLEITLGLKENLPVVLGDELELNRGFANLIENAINYTPNGGSIHLQSYLQDSELVIVVRDTGIGIKKTDLIYVFERFYRSNEAKNANRSGTGLGLAIVKQIIERHKGSIEVKSALGKGTSFIVRLPIMQ